MIYLYTGSTVNYLSNFVHLAFKTDRLFKNIYALYSQYSLSNYLTYSFCCTQRRLKSTV